MADAGWCNDVATFTMYECMLDKHWRSFLWPPCEANDTDADADAHTDAGADAAKDADGHDG
jgi:hypothetical protein